MTDCKSPVLRKTRLRVKIPKSPHTLVPRRPMGNVAWREDIMRMVGADPATRKELWILCSRDILFWINTFVWTYDPRKPNGVLPFATWPFQDDAIREVDGAVGSHDLVIEKSRDMGATWILVLVFLWRWLFRSNESLLLVSRNEDYVDKADNPKALFNKIDFALKYMPKWLLPKDYLRKKMGLVNHDRGNVIDGESTTANIARGDRRTAIGVDEFAAFEQKQGFDVLSATQDATNSRIFGSTPNGAVNAFAKLALRMPKIKKLTLHWSLHPEKAAGLYRVSDRGVITNVDETYWASATKEQVAAQLQIQPRNPRFEFRSPWYDRQCERAESDVQIAQELDIDYLRSGFPVFPRQLVDKHIVDFSCDPFVEGELRFRIVEDPDGRSNIEVLGFVPDDGLGEGPENRLKLWFHPDVGGNAPAHREYTVGADVSLGTGASNSCLVIVDILAREVVGEFVSPYIGPVKTGAEPGLADYAVALCKWLNDAALIWEANGPGHTFGKRVMALEYYNVYSRDNPADPIEQGAPEKPGWAVTPTAKQVIVDFFKTAMASDRVVVRSRAVLEDCKRFVISERGHYRHSHETQEDPSGARENHGDRGTGAFQAYFLAEKRREMPKPVEQEVQYGSWLWRKRQAEREDAMVCDELEGW